MRVVPDRTFINMNSARQQPAQQNTYDSVWRNEKKFAELRTKAVMAPVHILCTITQLNYHCKRGQS